MSEKFEILKKYYENQRKILDLINENDSLISKCIKLLEKSELSVFTKDDVWKVYTIRGELIIRGKKRYKYIQQRKNVDKRPHIISDIGYEINSSVVFPTYDSAKSFLDKFFNSNLRRNYDRTTEWKIVEYKTTIRGEYINKFYKKESEEYGEYFLPVLQRRV